MMNVEIKLNSQFRRHGTAGPKPTVVKSAAAAKMAQILMKQKQEVTIGEVGLSETENLIKEKHTPKEYGSHNGNHQVETFKNVEATEDNLRSLLVYAENMLSRFESMDSWDLATKKFEYTQARVRITEEYLEKHGSNLSDQVTTNLIGEVKEYSFKYTQHQISIIITSDIMFDGAKPTDTGFRREIKSKRIYTFGEKLLSKEIREVLKGSSDTESELMVTTNLGKAGRIVRDSESGKPRMIIDFGQLAGRIEDSDSY